MTQPLISWSFSRYNTYVQCPYLAKLKFIDKLKTASSPAMERGDAVHKAAEAYVKGTAPTVAPELAAFKAELEGLRERSVSAPGSVTVEASWSYRKDWSITRYDDWKGCWLRIKVDVASWKSPSELDIIDWKTGKYREESNEEYVQQVELYALGALKMHPELAVVTPLLAYTDQDFVYQSQPYTRADEARLQAGWERRVKLMMADTTFKPAPSNKCRWCDFNAAKGGPCRF